MDLLLILSVPALIALNAFFVAAEYAVVATRSTHIDSLRKAGRRRQAQALEKLKDNTANTIGTIQVCITMTNLLLGWIGEPAMGRLLHGLMGSLASHIPANIFRPVSFGISFIAVTLLTVVFSELLPKALTLRNVEIVARFTAAPVLAIGRIVWPMVWLMNKIANVVTRPLGLGRVDEMDQEHITAEELRLLTTEAAQEGELTPRERAVILNALTLADRSARQIMVPRVRVSYLDIKRSMEENRRIINERLYSRLLLCDGSIDNVIGILHTKEFLSAYNAAGDVSVLSLIARPPVFVPESTPMDKLLSLFSEKRSQMVVVLDEYGGVSGLVTLRDVVDELLGVGEPAVVPSISSEAGSDLKRQEVRTFTVPGDTARHDLATRLGRDSWGDHETAATVGGLLQEWLGHVPAVGEEIEIERVRLRVVEADSRRVLRVQVTPPEEEKETV
ncbi:MAG: HlyC/CorC family transporter [Phycisphaeraceae bacterium]|nr:HlyC/CorC family transporter [Phycisphaeraceae bacterium]